MHTTVTNFLLVTSTRAACSSHWGFICMPPGPGPALLPVEFRIPASPLTTLCSQTHEVIQGIVFFSLIWILATPTHYGYLGSLHSFWMHRTIFRLPRDSWKVAHLLYFNNCEHRTWFLSIASSESSYNEAVDVPNTPSSSDHRTLFHWKLGPWQDNSIANCKWWSF